MACLGCFRREGGGAVIYFLHLQIVSYNVIHNKDNKQNKKDEKLFIQSSRHIFKNFKRS